MFPEVPGPSGGRTLSAAWAGLLLCGAAICPERAWAKETFTVDLSAGAEVTNNPFLEAGGKAAVGAQAGIDGNYNIEGERTDFNLAGAAHSSTYLDGRGTDLAGSVAANLQHRINPRIALGLLGRYSYSRSSGYDYLLASSKPPAFPSDTPDSPSSGAFGASTRTASPAALAMRSSLIGGGATLPPDTTLIGRRVGAHAWTGAVTLNIRTSERSTLTLSTDANIATYNDSSLPNYRMFGQAVAFSRAISKATRISLQARIAEVKYDNGEHDVIASPMIGIERQLSPTFDLAVYGGASIVRTRLPDGSRIHSSGFAASVKLCGRLTRGQFCVSGERQELPSALGGVRTATLARAIYNTRLNNSDTLDLGLSFDRRGRDTRNLFPNQTTFGGSARYEHHFGNRLSVYASAGYVHFWQGGIPGRSDLRGGIGIAYRLGDRG